MNRIEHALVTALTMVAMGSIGLGCSSSSSSDGGVVGEDASDAGNEDGGVADVGPGADAGARQFTLDITNFTYSPGTLSVTPGAEIIVHNHDSMPHSVTSQSAPDQFVSGAVQGVSFDTGPFTGDRAFTIPASAPVGLMIPCFCTVHLGAMANRCMINVVATAP
jgi:plastocyanin